MTLVVALAGRHEVIIGAEQLCPLGDPDGQYSINYSKVRFYGGAAFGFAGFRSGVSLFETAQHKFAIRQSEPLGEEIKVLIEVMAREYTHFPNSRDDIRMIACGVDHGIPMIYTSKLDRGGSFYPTCHTEGRAAIGIEKHGALHFIHSYHRPEMPTNELAFLAYFSIAETIRHDTRVRGPVEIYVVREGVTIPLDQKQLEKLQASANEAKEKIGDVLLGASPNLDIENPSSST